MSNRSKEARERVLSSKERANFRQTGKWIDFRSLIKKMFNNTDPLTLKPLHKGWNLHHLDSRHEEEHYTDLSDPNKFMPLNKGSHNIIHECFRYYEKDPEFIKRLEDILRRMKEFKDES